MSSTTWQFNSARIQSRQLTVSDELDAEITAELIRGDTPFEIRSNYKRQKFAEFLHSSTIVEGTLGFELPDAANSTVEELRAAFEAWLNVSGLLREWRAALGSVEAEKK